MCIIIIFCTFRPIIKQFSEFDTNENSTIILNSSHVLHVTIINMEEKMVNAARTLLIDKQHNCEAMMKEQHMDAGGC